MPDVAQVFEEIRDWPEKSRLKLIFKLLERELAHGDHPRDVKTPMYSLFSRLRLYEIEKKENVCFVGEILYYPEDGTCPVCQEPVEHDPEQVDARGVPETYSYIGRPIHRHCHTTAGMWNSRHDLVPDRLRCYKEQNGEIRQRFTPEELQTYKIDEHISTEEAIRDPLGAVKLMEQDNFEAVENALEETDGKRTR